MLVSVWWLALEILASQLEVIIYSDESFSWSKLEILNGKT